MQDIKIRLIMLGHTQVWLVEKLREQGEVVHPSQMSAYISRAIQTPRAEKILAMVDAILTEEERRRAARGA